MGVGVAYPRGKNFITFEAVELLILNFYVASKTFLKLKQHRPAASAYTQRIHFKIWLGMANQLIVILRQHLRFSGFWKAMNFLKSVSLKKEVDWWYICKFSLTSVKSGFFSVNYTPVTWVNQWCYQLLISFQEVPSFNFIQYLEVKMLLRWCKPLPHRVVKRPFAKENEIELVNTYIKRQPTKFIKLRNRFTSEVQLITTCELPACRVYQASTFKL